MELDSPELTVARQAAQAGGAIISRYFHEGVEMRTKAVADLVSDADIESEHAIVAAIRSAFPDHAILGEESYEADVAAPKLWLVDPLDGTTNFAHGIPHFAISIAYYEAGQPRCGVIYNPIREDWYLTVAGQGAWYNGRRAQVNNDDSLSQSLVGVGFYYDRDAKMRATLEAIRELFGHQIHGIRRFGTASLDLAQVALGMYAAYFEFQLSAWDFAAGRLFVEEAGGRVTTCQGDPLPLSVSSVLASNGRLHDTMLEIVGKWYQAGQ